MIQSENPCSEVKYYPSLKFTVTPVHHMILSDLQPFSNGLPFVFAWDIWNQKILNSETVYIAMEQLMMLGVIRYDMYRIWIER